MNECFDVLIIGAGPAGGSAALHCAREGLSVLVVEEHERAGEPVHCGECLSEYACKNIGIDLPEKAISRRVKGVRIIFPNNKESILHENGFVLEKNIFEQWLLEEAEKNRAKKVLGARVTDFERKNNEWSVKTTKGNFKARVLIDGSGIMSIVSAKLGLNKKFESTIGIQHKIEGIKNDDYLDFFIWPKLAPEGYLWMIPKNNNKANVGLVTHEKNNAKKYLEEFLKEKNLSNKTKVKTFGGLIPSSGPLEKTFGEGLMIIGDAAGFTSPLFEGGTQLGMKSGQFAARVAKEAVEKNDYSWETFKKYQVLWKKEFPEYKKILKGKTALYKFSEEEINIIADNLPKDFDDFGWLQKIAFGIKIIAKKPGLLKKSFISAMLALGYSQAEHYGW